jgi:hemerythrin-like metal-binding protein
VPELDREHLELVRQLDELGLAMKKGRGRETLARLLAFLRRHVDKHFRDEEELMVARGYPEYPEHRAQHDLFRSRLAEQEQRFARRPQDRALVLEVHGWVMRWLAEHTISADGRLGDFLRERKPE